MYAAAMGCRVMVFEPFPQISRYLNISVILNGFQDRIEVRLKPRLASCSD